MKSSLKVCGKDVDIDGKLLRIARLTAEKYEYLDDPEAALDALRQSGLRIDLFTFMQNLRHTSPNHDYPMEWDNLAALPVTTFHDWWTKQINGKTRNMVRRAEKKGLVIREVPFDESLVAGIAAIYNESPTRQGKPFRHYGKDREAIRRENGTFLDRSVFIGAFLGAELIGFAKLVSDEHHDQAALMQIVSMIQHRDSAPTNALISQAVRSCAERQIPYLVYANFAYGSKQRDSLTDFKEHNGFKRIDVPRYYVPLTLAGRAALRVGLHHPIADHIPEQVASRLRQIRSRWHTHQLRTISDAS